jgi:hypothetical protein
MRISMLWLTINQLCSSFMSLDDPTTGQKAYQYWLSLASDDSVTLLLLSWECNKHSLQGWEESVNSHYALLCWVAGRLLTGYLVHICPSNGEKLCNLWGFYMCVCGGLCVCVCVCVLTREKHFTSIFISIFKGGQVLTNCSSASEAQRTVVAPSFVGKILVILVIPFTVWWWAN